MKKKYTNIVLFCFLFSQKNIFLRKGADRAEITISSNNQDTESATILAIS